MNNKIICEFSFEDLSLLKNLSEKYELEKILEMKKENKNTYENQLVLKYFQKTSMYMISVLQNPTYNKNNNILIEFESLQLAFFAGSLGKEKEKLYKPEKIEYYQNLIDYINKMNN